jgi:hypothetical protein
MRNNNLMSKRELPVYISIVVIFTIFGYLSNSPIWNHIYPIVAILGFVYIVFGLVSLINFAATEKTSTPEQLRILLYIFLLPILTFFCAAYQW